MRGALGGPMVQFEVNVAEADDGRLVLTPATGPIRLDVEYEAVAVEHGSQVRASVAVSGSGLRGRILARATDALLAGGALSNAVGRIADQFAPVGRRLVRPPGPCARPGSAQLSSAQLSSANNCIVAAGDVGRCPVHVGPVGVEPVNPER